jgi:hypothetical protein
MPFHSERLSAGQKQMLEKLVDATQCLYAIF